MILEDFCDPFKIVTLAKYRPSPFYCLAKETQVAIIALAFGTITVGPNNIRNFDNDVRNLLKAEFKHIDQVARFAEDLLNSTAFEQAHCDEWANEFELDFDGDMFWRILSTCDADMHCVVRFCYPIDSDDYLVEGGDTFLYTAFLD